MQPKDPSSSIEDQFSIDVSAFLTESVPGSGIKLLRARLDNEAAIARQLSIPDRLALLRRCATKPARSAESIPLSQHSPHRAATPPLKDEPPSDRHFVQDVAQIGTTSRNELVYLVLSVLTEASTWMGGWFLVVASPDESERFQAYLTDAREAIVAQLQHGAETTPPS
jgi:hypothetical protein